MAGLSGKLLKEVGAAAAQKLASKDQSGKASKAVDTATKVAGAAAWIPALKVLIPVGLVVLLIVAIIVAIVGVSQVVSNISLEHEGDKCDGYDSTEGWDQDILDWVFPDCGEDYAGGATGAGYTGDVYPPAFGRISSPFGPRGGGLHDGLDIAGPCMDPIYAYAGGEVVLHIPGSYSKGGAFNEAGLIIIKHTDNFYTSYGHTWPEVFVKVGDIVSAGDTIAQRYSNGNSTGCHLHFEMSTQPFGSGLGAGRYDPMPVMREKMPFLTVWPALQASMPPVPTPGDKTGLSGTPKEYASSKMASYGWDQRQFTQCLVPLWERESNWKSTAINPRFSPRNPATPEYQAYGIPQAGPGSKMASAGADWKTNPKTQIDWGLGYIRDRYGSPCSAWAHSERIGWY